MAVGFRKRLLADRDGVTIVEFAFAMPVLAVMLMALFDLGFQIYARSIVQGAVQEAARSSTIEGTDPSVLDANVLTSVRRVIPGANITFSRRNYPSFEQVGRAEDFTDGNSDGLCNNGEAYQDVNGNSSWDSDRGMTGVGGARDAVVYSATTRFNRVFPFHRFVGLPQQITIVGTTVLRNQPFADQAARPPVVRNCT